MSCKGCAVARRAPREQCGAHPGGAGASKRASCARSATAIGWRKLGCTRRDCAHLEEPWNPTRSLFQNPASRSLHKQTGCPVGAPLTTDSSRTRRIAALRACACNHGSADTPNPKPEGAHTLLVKLAQQLSLRRHPRLRMQLHDGAAGPSAARALASGCHAAHQTKHGLHTQEQRSL